MGNKVQTHYLVEESTKNKVKKLADKWHVLPNQAVDIAVNTAWENADFNEPILSAMLRIEEKLDAALDELSVNF